MLRVWLRVRVRVKLGVNLGEGEGWVRGWSGSSDRVRVRACVGGSFRPRVDGRVMIRIGVDVGVVEESSVVVDVDGRWWLMLSEVRNSCVRLENEQLGWGSRRRGRRGRGSGLFWGQGQHGRGKIRQVAPGGEWPA